MNDLPDQLPIHFNTDGHADRYGSKLFALLFLPSMACVTVISVSGLLRMSPEGYKAEQSRRTVTQLNFGVTLFLMMIYVALLIARAFCENAAVCSFGESAPHPLIQEFV
jgi:hypothetical protein